MKLFKQINPEIKIMEYNGKYYIKFRVHALFGLIKFWIYVTYESYSGNVYRPFYSIKSAELFIGDNSERFFM